VIFTIPMSVDSVVLGLEAWCKERMSRRAPAVLNAKCFFAAFCDPCLLSCGTVEQSSAENLGVLWLLQWRMEKHATAIWWACIHAGPAHKTRQLHGLSTPLISLAACVISAPTKALLR
jgi:hypothetical protein